MRRAPLVVLMALLVAGSAAGCGKRGAPRPPIHPVPAAVTSLSARLVGDQVQISFNIPSENVDHSLPPVLSRVELYGAVGPAVAATAVPFSVPVVAFGIPMGGSVVQIPSTPILLSRFSPTLLFPAGAPAPVRRKGPVPPTTAVAIATKKYLRDGIEIRPPGRSPEGKLLPEPPPPSPDDPRPAAGSVGGFTLPITAEIAGAAASPDAAVLRLLIVPVATGRRLGASSPLLEFPLTVAVPPPHDVVAAVTATALTLTWVAGAPAQSFRVYRSTPDGKEEPVSLTPAPLSVLTYSATPVTFGKEQCFVVHAVVPRGLASVESRPTAPTCVTPVDTFPPPAPTGLLGLPTQEQVQLVWTPVTDPDVAGYLVLRGQDGAPPAPLTAQPITEASYTDATVRAGARYIYTVVAVDAAGNRSLPSNPVDEVR